MTEGTETHSGRVLVVEDEMMISMLLEDMLGELGYETVGPASRLESALDMARDADVQAAILDVNLHGRPTWPVAEILRERGIPFMFATGYGAEGLAERYRSAPVLSKPFLRDELGRAMSSAIAAQSR